MKKIVSTGLFLLVVLVAAIVDADPAQSSLSKRHIDLEEVKEHLKDILNSPAVKALTDKIENFKINSYDKRGVKDFFGHAIGGAANVGKNVVNTGAGVVKGVGKTGVQLVQNLVNTGLTLWENLSDTGKKFIKNSLKGVKDALENVKGAAKSVVGKREIRMETRGLGVLRLLGLGGGEKKQKVAEVAKELVEKVEDVAEVAKEVVEKQVGEVAEVAKEVAKEVV